MTDEQTMRVRDAMIAEPRALPGTATAQEAGEVLTPAEVRAVYVVGDDGALLGVVTRKTLLEAVKNHQFVGADTGERKRINTPQMKGVAQALEAIGVRASKGVARVGAYELGAILEQGTGYQDRIAQHTENKSFKRRARIYLVPQQTSVERRQQLRRAADRESRLLEDVTALTDIERLRTLFEMLETKETVLRLLDASRQAEGVQIFIGAESHLFGVAGCSMIIVPYQNSREQIVGAIGVIGPTRINYARIIPMVDYTAKVIGRIIG